MIRVSLYGSLYDNIISSDEMDKLLNHCIGYLLGKFKSEQAAEHLLDGVSEIYDKLESNPNLYRLSEDPFMKALDYHEAKVHGMDYTIILKVVMACRSIQVKINRGVIISTPK